MLPVPSDSQRMSLSLALYRYFSVYYKKMAQRRAAAGGKQVAVEVRLFLTLSPAFCLERGNNVIVPSYILSLQLRATHDICIALIFISDLFLLRRVRPAEVSQKYLSGNCQAVIVIGLVTHRTQQSKEISTALLVPVRHGTAMQATELSVSF